MVRNSSRAFAAELEDGEEGGQVGDEENGVEEVAGEAPAEAESEVVENVDAKGDGPGNADVAFALEDHFQGKDEDGEFEADGNDV